nr:hypothetical protein [Streptomyces sp. FT05W]
MQATFADFSATPAGVSNAGIRYRHCHKASSSIRRITAVDPLVALGSAR